MADAKVQTIKKELDSDNRDVADLWTDALRKYKGIVGEDLQLKFTSVDAMISFGTQEMNSFHKFRHNEKKVDKLRSLFASNLDYIQKGAQQLIAAATPAFPPAAAIGTALTYMLSACKQVSADYDVVTAFFEDMNAFLQRITILESRLPKYPAYRNCLMDVFTSVLEMCGFATKFIELGRFKKWVLNMVRGEDGDLGGARKKMDTSLSRLTSATEYAILGNTEELQRMNSDLQQNQDMQTKMMEDQTRMLENVMQSQDGVRSDLQNIKQLLVMFDERRKEDGSKQKGTALGQSKKPPTFNQVRSYFEDTLNPAHEYRYVKESYIPETSTWVFDEPLWGNWLAREPGSETSSFLALLGPPGAGKSHLAAVIYDRLVGMAAKDTANDTCVASFYFRETTKDLNELWKAVNWAVLQIADQSTVVCEKICAQLQQEDLYVDNDDWKDVWTKLVQPCFTSGSKSRLYVVWDGCDELSEWDLGELWKFFALVKDTADLNVKFICTARSTLEEHLRKVGAQCIQVSKEKQLPDLKALIWHHLNNDSGLRRFSKYAKQRISSTLEEKADGLLYAEHLLRQFSIFGRESLVLRALQEEMPKGLEGLYANMVADLQHHTPENELQAMKILLGWIAHSYRPPTLAECLSLLEITSNTSFDLERELQGRQLARILKIGDLEERITDTVAEVGKLDMSTPTKIEAPIGDGDLPLKFQERSMAAYFGGGSEGLRTVSKDANREAFILCSDILCGRHPHTHEGLRQYAARCWLYHLSWSELEEDTEQDKIRLLNALGSLMSNETSAATVIEILGVDYEEVDEDFDTGDVMNHMSDYSSVAMALKDKMTATTVSWAGSVTANRETAFEALAKGHLANWFRAEDAKPGLRSFKFARSAINMKNTDKPDHSNDSSSGSDDASDDGDGGGRNYSAKDIISVFNAYEDLPKDSNAYRVVGDLLVSCKRYGPALPFLRKALKLCTDPALRFRILNSTAVVHIHQKQIPAAKKALHEAFLSRNLASPRFVRMALITRARTEVARGKLNEAMVSFEEARRANLEELMPGNYLKDTFKACLKKRDDALLIETIKKWKPMERLAFMTWDFDDSGWDDHEALSRAAFRTGQQEYLYQAYDEVLKLLENVNAAAPVRFQLAIVKWYVGLDAEGAKSLLNETLDSTTSGESYAFTNEDPATTLVYATVMMTEIIYAQYRTTPDHARKAELYVELQGLTQRPLARSIAPPKSDLAYHSLTLARMARKMASAAEYQRQMQNAFGVCYEALVDNVNWNDGFNLSMLAIVLSSMGGLETEAQFMLSAQFSKLDPAVKDEYSDSGSESEDEGEDKKTNGVKDAGKEDDGDEDYEGKDDDDEDGEDDEEEDDSLPSDEGDLADNFYSCDGECHPTTQWLAWKGRPMYTCLICSDTCLCEPCYHKRQEYNKLGAERANEACRASAGAVYCGFDHKYVRGPIPGWKGIKDGVMTVESSGGEEGGRIEVKFTEWLKEVKEVKWKEAWKRFWLKEDL